MNNQTKLAIVELVVFVAIPFIGMFFIPTVYEMLKTAMDRIELMRRQ